MRTETSCSWLPEAADDLEALVARSSPAVARRLAPAVARVARMNGGEGLRDALLRPGSTPFVALVEAAAADLGLAGDPRVASIGRATVLLYLYVRIQDDMVDEEELIDRAAAYAMESALSAHLELLAEAGIPASAWRARSRLMSRFAERSAEEVDERDAQAGAEPERSGEKFLCMAVPLSALGALAGREELHEVFADFVVHLGTALQMVNDVLNAAEDHAGKRPTPLLRRVAAVNDVAPAALRALLFQHPATRELLALAGREAERASELAAAHGLERLAMVARGVGQSVERTEARLLGLMLGIAA